MTYIERIAQLSIVLVLLGGVPVVLSSGLYRKDCLSKLNVKNGKSIDLAAQKIAQNNISKAIQDTQTTYADYVLLDADNGHIIATYNTEPSRDCSLEKWEPGSVVKPLTVAAALNEQAISKDFTFFDTGNVNVSGRQISNWSDFPKANKNLETLLEDSLNIGAIAVLSHLIEKSAHEQRKDVWYDYLAEKFNLLDGFDKPELAASTDFNSLNYRSAISSIGLGITTTPTRLSLAYATMLNGGTIYEACSQKDCVASGQKVLSADVSGTMKKLLANIYVSSRPKEIGPEYIVGGKTGSAPLALPDGRYLQDRETGTFVGYVSHGPKTYIQLVRLDMPKNHLLVSSAAKEVWGSIVVDLARSKAL